MKKLILFLTSALLASPSSFAAESLQSAEVTKVVNDVRIFHPSASARKASLGDVIQGKTSLQTGRRSRSEVRFQDDTISRLGSNSIFSFEQGTRDLRLEQGTILLAVPKDAGGARIRTATVTAAVTGTTIMMEYFLEKWVKIIVLEGRLVTWVEQNGKKSRQKTIKAGQMVVLKATDTRMPSAVDVDLQRLLKTSGLASQEIFGPLPETAQNRISTAINQQSDLKSEGILVASNRGIGAQGGGGPAATSSSPGTHSAEARDIVNDSVPSPPPIREGDDPGA